MEENEKTWIDDLKEEIDTNIKPNNHKRDITGAKLNTTLKEMVDELLEHTPKSLSELEGDTTHRTVTDEEKQTWGKSAAIFDEQQEYTDAARLQALANVSNQTVNSTTGKMGYAVLQPQDDEDLENTSFAAQIANKPNTIFEIRDVFDLGSTQDNSVSVTIPANCTLKFNGGCVKNGTITLNNTKIENGNFVDVLVAGTIAEDYVCVDWFHSTLDDENKTLEDREQRTYNGIIFSDILQSIVNLSNERLDIEFTGHDYPIHKGVALKSHRNFYSNVRSDLNADNLLPLCKFDILNPTKTIAPMMYDISRLEDISFCGLKINAFEKKVLPIIFEKDFGYNENDNKECIGIKFKDQDTSVPPKDDKADVCQIGYCIRFAYSHDIKVVDCDLICTASNAFTANGNNCYNITLDKCNFLLKRIMADNTDGILIGTGTTYQQGYIYVDYDVSMVYIGGGCHSITNCTFNTDMNADADAENDPITSDGGLEAHGFDSYVANNRFENIRSCINMQFLTFASPNLKQIQGTVENNVMLNVERGVTLWSARGKHDTDAKDKTKPYGTEGFENYFYTDDYKSFGNVRIINNYAQVTGSFVKQDSALYRKTEKVNGETVKYGENLSIDYNNVLIENNTIEYPEDVTIPEWAVAESSEWNNLVFGVINITNSYWSVKNLRIIGNTFNRVPFSVLRLKGNNNIVNKYDQVGFCGTEYPDCHHGQAIPENIHFEGNIVKNLWSYPYRQIEVERIINPGVNQYTVFDSLGINKRDAALFNVKQNCNNVFITDNSLECADEIYAPKLFNLMSDVTFERNSFPNGTIWVDYNSSTTNSRGYLYGDIKIAKDYFDREKRTIFFSVGDIKNNYPIGQLVCKKEGSVSNFEFTNTTIEIQKIGYRTAISEDIDGIEVGDEIEITGGYDDNDNYVLANKTVMVIGKACGKLYYDLISDTTAFRELNIYDDVNMLVDTDSIVKAEFVYQQAFVDSVENIPDYDRVRKGTMVYVEDDGKYVYFDGVEWIPMDDSDIELPRDYLTFTALEDDCKIALKFKKDSNISDPDPKLEYCIDGDITSWQPLVCKASPTDGDKITLNAGQYMYIRRDKNEQATTTLSTGVGSDDSSTYFFSFVMSGKIEASGNIMSLLSYRCNGDEVGSYCFYKLFSLCTSLVTTPSLPANTVNSVGYYLMFGSCSGLVKAEPLMGSSINASAYRQMFSNCGALREVEMKTIGISSTKMLGDSGVLSLTIHDTTPPNINSDVLNGLNPKCIIYVPAESVGDYKNNQYWGAFTIEPIGGSSGGGDEPDDDDNEEESNEIDSNNEG